ncbi:hypothetical protein [Plasmodium yoelii yoelii]|uniref:Uncharacterized protein n=1 Tax=Plasmodium yoelii yoelii TaxID=73239 RepID=Q7RHJ3_PLAYO|nr:hypothetical protein [Plasmodium yoelii yoelii]
MTIEMTNHKLYIQDETVDVTLILFKNVTNSKDVLEIYNKLSADISSSDHQNKFFLILDSQLVRKSNIYPLITVIKKLFLMKIIYYIVFIEDIIILRQKKR